MTSNNLGSKRVCPKCDAKFYDFGVTNPIKCPKCAHSWAEGAKKKAAAPKKEAKPAPKPVRKPAREDDELLDMAGDLPEIEDGDAVEELEPMEDDGVELTSLEEVEEHEESENDENSDDADDEMFTDLSGDNKIVDDFEEHEEDEDEDGDEDEDDEDEDEDDDDTPRKRRR